MPQKTYKYNCCVTRDEFQKISKFFDYKKHTKEPKIDKYEIFNAILYRLKNGCSWRNLPIDFPNYKTVFLYFREWTRDGILSKISKFLREEDRKFNKKSLYPNLLIVDSQAVDNTESASVKNKGFCHYKLVNGVKRHLCVDVLGNPLDVVVTPANVTDDNGFLEIIKKNIEFFEQPNLKVTLLFDSGYHKNFLLKEIAKISPNILEHIDIKIAEKMSPNFKKNNVKRDSLL